MLNAIFSNLVLCLLILDSISEPNNEVLITIIDVNKIKLKKFLSFINSNYSSNSFNGIAAVLKPASTYVISPVTPLA